MTVTKVRFLIFVFVVIFNAVFIVISLVYGKYPMNQFSVIWSTACITFYGQKAIEEFREL